MALNLQAVRAALATAKPLPGGCLIYPHAVLCIGNMRYQPHRVAYALSHGDPGDRFVVHSCPSKGCVNPDHLALGTLRAGMGTRRPHDLRQVWKAMRTRCSSPKYPEYHLYGGRGIQVCERWMNSFEAFCADMGPRPLGAQLDRIDNDGNYEPGNCRWATPTEQARNRRTTKFVEWRGETLSVPDWANRIGLPIDTLYHRLERWSTERSLTTPLKRRTQRARIARAS